MFPIGIGVQYARLFEGADYRIREGNYTVRVSFGVVLDRSDYSRD